MDTVDVTELLNIQNKKDPCFFVDFLNVGRGLIGEVQTEEGSIQIQKTKHVKKWKIVDNELKRVDEDDIYIFFDKETYIIEWTFDVKMDKTLNEETIVYYWKGSNAQKSFSPLPPYIEQHFPVERIFQWSEPALFFHIFAGRIIVFSGKEEDFNPEEAHLFIVRGEIESEVHLYEIPCKTKNLRSRTSFLLVAPEKGAMIYWHGLQTLQGYKTMLILNLQPHNILKSFEESWRKFPLVQLKEGCENRYFLETVEGKINDYFSITTASIDFTPRLFYLNSITGSFLATEIEYSLRYQGHTAAFPFLQSHLYTATQPALFVLDNNTEIWLWQGWKPSDYQKNTFENELKLSKELVLNYAKEKEKCIGTTVIAKYVYAGLEPVEFKNIFPLWTEWDNITEKQIQDGFSALSINVIKT